MKRIASIPYSLVPNIVIEDSSLEPPVKGLYILLLKFSNKDGYCNASQTKLASHINRHKRSIKTYLSILKKRSLIEVIPQTDFKSTNIYIPLVTIEGKSISPHTGNYYHPLLPEDGGSQLPTKSNLKIKVNSMRKELVKGFSYGKNSSPMD